MYRPPLRKRLLNSRAAHVIVSLLMSLIMRMIYASCRVTRSIAEDAEPYMRGEKNAVFCFWHGRLIMQPFIKPPGHNMRVLISHHNDGALITATIAWFGVGSVRGSRKLGGPQALRTLLELTAQGDNIAITPDGPRGPFQKAAPGAAFVAANTHYPLVPIAFSSTRHWRFNSWDRFLLPKPFSRIHYAVGAPIHVAENANTDATSALLESALIAITDEADRHCGVPS